MKTSLAVGTMLIVVIGGTAGTGLLAFFSDEAVSNANLISTATVDLQIDGQESIGAFVSGSDILPGECVDGSTVLTNVGNRFGTVLGLDIFVDSYVDSADMARFIEVTNAEYGTHLDMQATIADQNSNGWPDIEDWYADESATFDLTEPGALGTTFSLELCLNTAAANDLQADSLSIDFGFLLRQAAGTNLPVAGALVSHWSFEETTGLVVSDSFGTNHGTRILGAASGPGRLGNGLVLDGVDDYVEVPDAPSLDLATYTAAAWVLRGTVGDTWYAVLSKGPMPENYAFFVHRTGSYVHHAYTADGIRHHYDSGSVAAHVWTHVAITFDGSVARTYVDGTFVGGKAAGGVPTMNAEELRIGHRETNTHWFNGTLDEVVLYNTALTAAELQQLMAATS